MDETTQNKIILGSVLKADKAAKRSGKLCTTDISLIKVIMELRNCCCFDLTFEQQQCLDSKILQLQSNNKSICKYKQLNYNDKKFIN